MISKIKRYCDKNLVFTIFLGFLVPLVWSQDDSLTLADLSEMSIEDLMNVQVETPASLTHLGVLETPASVTKISREDILGTPARNITDLIEIYVPGAIWMNYEEGPLLGVRGLINHRNSKYLMILNGKVISTKGAYAAKSELEQWELSDIEHIEIIRGPGSVTYGPGAVAGVISIRTRNASTMNGVEFTGQAFQRYNSLGGAFQYGVKSKNVNAYLYGSVTRTEGYTPLHYLGSNSNDPGYVGRDIDLDTEPLDYFSDVKDVPQAKMFLDLEFLEDWNIWFRYTQQGATWSGNEKKSIHEGKLLNLQSTRDRQFITSLRYSKKLSTQLELKSMASASFFDVERQKERIYEMDLEHPSNFKYNFSESEYLLNTRLNYVPSKFVEVAIGGEVSLDSTGPGWGDDQDVMRQGGDGVIVSGGDSKILGYNLDREDAVFAGNGWTTVSLAGFGETNILLAEKFRLLFSGRLDKNSHTDWLISPRMAAIANLAESHLLKLIIQRSLRRNESGQLFIEDKNNSTPSTETINSYEVIYKKSLSRDISFDLSTYYSDANIIGWDTEIDKSIEIGDLELWGFETEVRWDHVRGNLGLNYSLVEQINWRLNNEASSSGISYADYNLTLKNSELVQLGYGNDLNNWPNQSAKFFVNYKLGSKVYLHGDGQYFWDYQGSLDGLSGLALAVKGDSTEADFEDALDDVHKENVFRGNFRLNISLKYKPAQFVSINLYVLNLLGTNSNKRYAYDSGSDRISPSRVRFIREDRAVGFELM